MLLHAAVLARRHAASALCVAAALSSSLAVRSAGGPCDRILYTTLLCWSWSWQGFAEGEKEDVVAQLQLWWRHEAFGRIKECFGSAPPPPSAQAPSHDVVL